MQDKNKEVRRVCDMTLEIISVCLLNKLFIDETLLFSFRNVILIGQVVLNLHAFVIIIKHGLRRLKDNKFLMKMMNHHPWVMLNHMVLTRWHSEIKMTISINLVTTKEVKHLFCLSLDLVFIFENQLDDYPLDGRESPDMNHWNSLNSGAEMDIDR